MTRILMPTIIATSIAGVLQALLNAQRSYRAASLQGVALNLVTILFVLRFSAHTASTRSSSARRWDSSRSSPCSCRTICGVASTASCSICTIRGCARFGIILGPIVVGSAVGQVNLLFDKYFASKLLPGNIAAMHYATKVVGFPQQLFAVAIATVIFPILSAQFATKEIAALRAPRPPACASPR